MSTKAVANSGHFKKGHPKFGGRQPGTPNKTTATIRDAIIEAFVEVGGARYLVRLANENPSAFVTLLSRILPTEVSSGPAVIMVRGGIDPKLILEGGSADSPRES